MHDTSGASIDLFMFGYLLLEDWTVPQAVLQRDTEGGVLTILVHQVDSSTVMLPKMKWNG